MTEIFLDALIDTLKIIPFLYLVYLLIEYTEHSHADKLSAALRKLGPFGSIGGALLGSIPQCGFSAAASNLYTGRLISAGTLISVYIATSDEAIPMLISNPKFASALWTLIVIKIIIALIVGFIVDIVLKMLRKNDEQPDYEDICRDCHCDHHNIFTSALIHTVKISLFIFIVSLILGGAIELAGAEKISHFLMQGSIFQPFITALFGFIPNCASSVVITQLYIEGALSFGSCVAGLCTGAGVGLLILFRTNRRYKENFAIMGVMYAAAVISGLIINAVL